MPFAWERALHAPRVDIHIGGQLLRLCLDDLQLNHTLRVERGEGGGEDWGERVVRYAMAMEGPTKVLTVGQGDRPPPPHPRTGRSMSVWLSLVGISLIDKTPRELLYLSAEGVGVRWKEGEGRENVHISVSRMQVDNQLPHATFPVTLHPSWDDEEETSPRPPALELLVVRNSAAPTPYLETVRHDLDLSSAMRMGVMVRGRGGGGGEWS